MDKEIEIYKTQDGSLGLYNKRLKEVYHSKFGAKKEAFEKFVEPCFILPSKPLDILDICYGIGYNTKTALLYLKNINSIDCVETNPALVRQSFCFDFDEKINKTIENNFKNENFIHFFIEDIRKMIKKTNKKYDIIFHDGFAPYKQPSVWSEDLIKEISKKMKPDALYLTYNHSKPVLNALKGANLYIGKTLKNSKTIGTVASFNKELIINPLDNFDIETLNTKSAITYKDKNLNLKDEEILKNRQKEVNNSTLVSLSHIIKKRIKENT